MPIIDQMQQALSKTPTKRDQTVKNAQRVAYPGVYGRPDEIAAMAASRVAPEDPALKQLFGVTRADMYEAAKGRKGMPHLGMLPGAAANPRGSEPTEGVMNKRNEQRLLDVMEEAGKHQGLAHGMDPWYYMDPMFEHMVKLLGPEKAAEEYKKMNALSGMASSASEVNTEIPRGSLAYWLQNQGRFNEFVQHGGKRDPNRPADFGEVPGHLAHKTAHAVPMKNFLTAGNVDMSSPKVPMYIEASGVPAIGFQTRTPVGDAHWSRAVGLADTRNIKMMKGKEMVPGHSVTTPEMSALGPWWAEKIAKPLGLESVPAQARAWGAFSPQTGVTTPIGSPKLELIAKQIMLTAKRLGVSPEKARDLVLTGKERMGMAEGGHAEGCGCNTCGPSQDEMLAHVMLHKANGGLVDIKTVGAEEAPDMPVKEYVAPSGGQGLPVGGVDFQPEQPGQQLTPGAPDQPPGQIPGQPGQIPQQPAPLTGQPTPSLNGPQAPALNQPNQMLGGPPMPPFGQPRGPQSNILAMTPQGQAMQAMRPSPTPMPRMAKGGSLSVEQMRQELQSKRGKQGKQGTTHDIHMTERAL